jgi:DNA-binding NarL/FixJ family response regulator
VRPLEVSTPPKLIIMTADLTVFHIALARPHGGGHRRLAADFPMEYSVGHADALQRLRMRAFGVVITSPDSSVEEDLALLEEMRGIRPGVKSIVLARHSTPDEVIAALRARVFACFTPPFDPGEIANLALGACVSARIAATRYLRPCALQSVAFWS